MHLGRIYPLLEFVKGGRRDTSKLDQRSTQSVISTEAYSTVYNDWRSTLMTATTGTHLMGDTYPNQNINAGQRSPAAHVSASWIPGQSSFSLLFSPVGGAASTMNVDIGRAPSHDTAITGRGGPAGQAGAMLAPTKAFSSYDYNMYFFAGPGILPPLINSVLNANLAALNKYFDANPFKPPVSKVDILINSLPASISCSYAAISPVTEGDLTKLNINAIIDITGIIGGSLTWKGITTNFGVNLNGISVLLQANVDVNALKVQVTGFQVSAKGFFVSNDVLTVIEVLFPPLFAVIDNPYLVAGLLNANYNSNIIAALNNALGGLMKLPTDFHAAVNTIKAIIAKAEPLKRRSQGGKDGVVSERVQRGSTTDYSSWMSSSNIQGKMLNQIRFPGTHDSATYALQDQLSLISYSDIAFLWLFDYSSPTAPVNGANPFGQKPYYLGPILGNYILERVKRVSEAQDQSILDQLKGGIRVFDLRIYYDPADGVCYSQHGLKGVRLDDILNQVKTFFHVQPLSAEFVMLQISHTNFGDYPAAITSVTQMVEQILGGYIYVPSGAEGVNHFDFNSLGSATLSSITGGKNKVMLMNTDDSDSWTFAQHFVNTAGFGSPTAGGKGLYQVSTSQALNAMDIVGNVLQALIGGQEQWLLGWYAQKNNAGLKQFLQSQTGPYNLVNSDWYEVSADGVSTIDVIMALNQ